AALGLGHQCTTAEPALPSANRLFIAARFPLHRIHLRAGPGEPGRLLLLASIEAPQPLTLGAMHVPNRVTGRKDLFYTAVLALLIASSRPTCGAGSGMFATSGDVGRGARPVLSATTPPCWSICTARSTQLDEVSRTRPLTSAGSSPCRSPS